MNNKEFTTEMARRMGTSLKETSQLMSGLIAVMSEQLQEGNVISLQGFGVFEVKKKGERVTVNPATKLRMLIPPKLVLTYRPGSSLKEKFK